MAITLNGTTGITTPADTVTGNATVGGTLTVGGVNAVAVAPGTSGNVLTSNGTAWTSAAPAGGGLPTPSAIGQIPFSTNGSTYTATQKITQGTAVASTSGTSIDFTSIPSWVKRVTVMFNQVSTSGSSPIGIQIGTSSGIDSTSTYNGSASYGGGGAAITFNTTSFVIESAGATSSSTIGSGISTLCSFGSNIWIESGTFSPYAASTNANSYSAGQKTLSGTLDRVRITTVNGTDTFDAGSINIMYE